MSLFLATSLTSCVTVRMPDAEFLKDCPLTYLKDGPVTNEDIVLLAQEREFDLRRCNLDKAALRAWFDAQKRGRLGRP